jgi:methionyl-tRNA formyltransferase
LSAERILFMGTPAFACPTLETLLRRPEPVVGVVCQPDRPRGRGLGVTAPETKRVAETHGIPVLQPTRVREPAFADALRALAPTVTVVAAFGRILPRAILDLPARGSLNVHASLLPRHRGAAPIEWAIIEGDVETGVSIVRMAEELDAGDVLLQRAIPIGPETTRGTLAPALAALGAELIGEALDRVFAGTAVATPQATGGVTYAPRIEREHMRLDWSEPAARLERVVRAFAPTPGAFTTLNGRQLKVHRAAVIHEAPAAAPGTVVAASGDGIVVRAGEEALALHEVQLEGRRRMDAAAFLAGRPIAVGSCLGES